MNLLPEPVENYLNDLAAPDDEPVLLEMEELARERGFPIVGRLCGKFLEVLARAINARRIFELGSGYGYSAYWFSRSTGPEGEIHLTDGDPDNERRALDFLRRAGLDGPVTYHVGDALTSMKTVDGDFDIVYCDIDKDGYPDAWRRGRERVRVGGLYVCDNMLWSGRVAGMGDDQRPEWTAAIDETNRLIASDGDFRSFINPTRDGVVAALRIR